MNKINIFPLGGQDENGKNSFGLEINQDMFLINSGIMIPINNKNGIDGIIPEFKYICDNSKKLKGLFLTHVHDEAFAALPWLLMEIKSLVIYGSAFTIAVAKERVSKYNINHNNYRFQVISEKEKIGNIYVRSFEVANSIPGSLAYAFETKEGNILFMSNFTNGNLEYFGKTNLNNIKEKLNNNIFALLLDSRNANYNGHSFEKKSVKSILETRFKNAKDNERIIIGAFDEEMFTILEVIELAIKYNRPIVPYGKSFVDLYKHFVKIYPKIKKINFTNYKEIQNHQNAVVLVTSTMTRLYQRFVRIANNNDVYLKFKFSDNIIMLGFPIHGMETEYSESLDEVARVAPNILDVSQADFYNLRPTKDDIFSIVNVFKPKYFLPMSSLYRYMVIAKKQAIKSSLTQDKCIILQNGRIAKFIDGNLVSQKEKLPVFGDVIIDGFGIGDISFEVIKERMTLATSGLVSISVVIDKDSKEPISEINVQILGIAKKEALEPLKQEVNSIVLKNLKEAESYNYRDIQRNIRKRIQRVFNKLVNKEPMVIMTFL